MKSIPKQIAIEVTSRCQLRCKNCMKTLGYPDQDMSLEFFKSIIDRNTFDATVIPYQNGEPLLHPQITEMIQYVVDHNMRCYITTNGMIWNEELFQLITEKNRVFQIIFSLDGLHGCESESIEKARPGSNRKKIVENILRFRDMKESKGNNIDLCVKFCHRGQDWQEMEDFVYHWLKEERIDYVCVGQMLNQSGEEMRIYPCQYFDSMYMLIRADKEIIPCMYCYDVAIKNYFNIGKLDETTDLITAYNTEIFRTLRIDQHNKRFHGPCKTCASAYTGFGYRGSMTFNQADKKDIGIVYFQQDYYNKFFSLKDKRIGVNHGNQGEQK